MTRGGVLLAVASMLALAPAAAAGRSGSQPDLMIVSRGGAVLNGDDIYNEDGVGQQRNLVVDRRIVVKIRIEHDDKTDRSVELDASGANSAFDIEFSLTGALKNVQGPFPVTVQVAAGTPVRMRVIATTHESAMLGDKSIVTIVARDVESGATDAVLIKLTSVSTPD